MLQRAELPPEPGLRSLRCRSFTVTARSGGKKKGGHQEIPALPPSFKTGKRPEQWQETEKSHCPPSAERWREKKTFPFPLTCPLPSPPKDIQHGGQCSCQSSLDGSSPLQQDLSCFNKLICQTFQAQKSRPSGNSVAKNGNAACGFHTLAVWTTQQVAAFRPEPKLLHRTEVGLAKPTTPPVSYLLKELQSEAAFFS